MYYISYYQSKQAFCKQLAENARQRDEIESLRVERNRFDSLYKKLEKELQQLQKKKGELIESSTQAYDARSVFIFSHLCIFV